MTRTVVVIGGGHAAAEAVVALYQLGWREPIVMLSDEPYLPYQRPPLSKAFLKTEADASSLAIKNAAMYDKIGADIRLNTRVDSIDRATQQVVTASGARISYDYLIIATGTRPRPLEIEGFPAEQVHYLRTLDDAQGIKSAVVSGASVLLVGAGYIGLELAASVVSMGAMATVLEAQPRVLARVTCDIMSDFYTRLHRAHGVDIRVNAMIASVAANESGWSATLQDGSVIDFDVLVAGIGVVPNIELAQDAGLACDNGIVVDDTTRTSDPHIFAIGDCANHPSLLYQTRLRLESVPNANEQAKVAAAAIVGKPVVHDALPWFWSDQYEIKLQTAGLATGYDQLVIRGEPASGQFAIFYLQEGRLIAVDAVNRPADFMMARRHIPTGIRPDPVLLADPSQAWC